MASVFTTTSGRKTYKDSATSADTYVVGADATSIKLVGKVNGDTIALEGLASEYKVKASGRTITLTNDDGQKVVFQLANKGTATISFLDGSLTASFKGKVAKLGTQKLSTKAVAVNDAGLDVTKTSIDTFDPAESAGSIFTLTAGIDQGAAFVGTDDDDTFNALDSALATATFTAMDSIDGGDGTDTLNIIQTTAVSALPSAIVKNIETANVTSAASVNIDTAAWTGLTQLNVISAASGAEIVTASTTTGVSVNNSTGFNVNVVGGGLVGSVTTGATGTITIGNATIPTAADANAFTSVTIKGGSAAFVTDNSGDSGAIGTTLTSVTVDGTAGAVALAGDAVANVTVKNGTASTAVTVTNAATADQTLNLTLDNNASGAKVVDATAKTVNVTATGSNSSTIDLTIAGATALTTAGAADLTLATTTANYTALKTLTINNTGAFNADLSAISTPSAAALTSIVATASTGANTLAIDAEKTAYAGGSGVDTVAIAAAATMAISGGAGAADVINLAGLGDTLLTAATGAKITNFEVLSTTGGSGNFDAALLTGITGLTQGTLKGAVTYNNVAAGTRLTVTESNSSNTTAYNLANVLGTTDALNLTVKSAGIVDTGAITANGVETINVASTDTDTTQHQNTVNLASTALKSVVITGNAGVALTAKDTTITSVDASALSLSGTVAAGAGFTWTSGAVTDNLVVKGSATGGDNINVFAAATATKTVTVTTFAGTNTITGSGTLVNNITGGTGADTITGGSAADVIVGGGGADKITGGAGADKITISGNTATIVIGATSDSGANVTDSTQVAELTSTFDTVTGATAGTKIDLSKIQNFGTADLVLNGTNLAGQDNKIVFVNGTYNAAAGTFTYAANGADTVVTYDTDTNASTAYESIILVGVDAGAATTATSGIITLA